MTYYLIPLGFIIAAFIYLLIFNIIPMYHTYWFYKRQGLPIIGFPLPILGNLLILATLK